MNNGGRAMRMHNESLDNKTIDLLQELIRANLDSRDGFAEAAERMEDPVVSQLFRQLVHDRDLQCHELQAIVSANAEQPCETGSASGAQRTWMDLRSVMVSGRHAVLSEAERGEDALCGRYDDALRELGGSAIRQLIERHHRAVHDAHDRVRSLKSEV